MRSGCTLIWRDRLLDIWQSPDGRRFTQRKRLAAGVDLDRFEHEAYARAGTVHAVARIKHNRNIGLREAVDVLNKARGGTYKQLRAKQRSWGASPVLHARSVPMSEMVRFAVL